MVEWEELGLGGTRIDAGRSEEVVLDVMRVWVVGEGDATGLVREENALAEEKGTS